MRRWFALVAFAAATAASATEPLPQTPARTQRAAPQAVIEAVQMPAWVERGTTRLPLAPGMSLVANDNVRTGANARLLLKLADGSVVKLGENAQLRMVSIGTRKDNVFVAAMNVLEGAFRFTTAALARARKREVDIRFVSVTAGIRGTDLWGKSAPDREIVCLIEGKIDVQREGDSAIQMEQPLSFYVAPRGQPAEAVRPVDPAQLKQWALETEIESGKGAARRDGKWKVVLASGTESEVFPVYRDTRTAGYAAEIQPSKVADRRVYDIRIGNLPSKAEAQALAEMLAGKYGIATPRVTQ
jgi:hypothetical protein